METISRQSLDISEKGAPAHDGKNRVLDRRLFMQLQCFSGCQDTLAVADELEKSGLTSVLYLDLSDPQGIGVLGITEHPDDLTGKWRDFLNKAPFLSLSRKAEFTMTGRTYAIGRETNLEDWLLAKPKRNVLNPAWPWAVWYPLRRKPEFELLSHAEQAKILGEHAMIGMAYGEKGYAADIRLACHGMDKNDNEFVIGLVGPELFPLSRLIQDMRKSQQTARYIDSMGPFFCGKVMWQSPF